MSFWAVEIEPGKEYSTILPYDLVLKQAALGATAKEGERNILHVKFGEDKKDFVLGSLRLNSVEQIPLKLVFEAGENVGFHVSGSSSIHLCGTQLVNPDEDDEFGDEFDPEELAAAVDNAEEGDSEQEEEMDKVIKQAALNAGKKRPNEEKGKQQAAKKQKGEDAAPVTAGKQKSEKPKGEGKPNAGAQGAKPEKKERGKRRGPKRK